MDALSVTQSLNPDDIDAYIPFMLGNGDIGGTFDPFCGTTCDQLRGGKYGGEDIRTLLLTRLKAQDYWEEAVFDPDKLNFCDLTRRMAAQLRDSGQGYFGGEVRGSAFGIFVGIDDEAFPAGVERHEQELDYRLGLLKSSYAFKGGRFRTELFIHPGMSVLVYRLRGDREMTVKVSGNGAVTNQDGVLVVESLSNVYCPAAAAVGTQGGRVEDGKIIIPAGRECSLFIAYGHRFLGSCRQQALDLLREGLAKGYDRLRSQSDEWWRERWSRFDLTIPDKQLERMWKYSLYYLICSVPRRVRDGLSGEAGLAGSFPAFGVGYHPQDSVYHLWALLTTGNTDLVKPSLEWFLEVLPIAREIARSFFWRKGASYTWHGGPGMLPFMPGHRHFSECLYEHHVNGWIVFIIDRYLEACGRDRDEAARYFPIVEGIAEFFASLLTPAGERLEARYLPSQSQGEHLSLLNKPNLFDVLAAAKFSLQTAALLAGEMGLSDKAALWGEMASRVSLAPLRRQDGTYRFYEGEEDASSKICVQFMGLIFPIGLDHRDILRTYDYLSRQVSFGSVGFDPAYVAIGFARMGEAERALSKITDMFGSNLSLAEPPLYMMFRESSPAYLHNRFGRMPYFMGAHALFVQAINEMLMQDWTGEVKLFPACPFNECSFKLSSGGRAVEASKE